MSRQGRKRLSVDIPKRLHDSLVIIAERRNITLTKYIIRALIRYSIEEAKYENSSLLDEYKN